MGNHLSFRVRKHKNIYAEKKTDISSHEKFHRLGLFPMFKIYLKF